MKPRRASRLVVPLFLGLILFGLYWFVRQHPSFLGLSGTHQVLVTRILEFLAAVPLIMFLIRAVDLLVFDLVASRRTSVRAPLLLREIVSIVLYLILLGWAVSAIFQYSVTTVLATGTVLAAILGLALQDTLGNLFAGIALHLDDSFAPGDVIRTGDYFGTVEAMRWRGTRIRTFNNNIVVVPNSLLSKERVEVFPRENENARVLQIGIDYHVPPATVLNVLVQAASNIEGVSHVNPAIARVGNFGDSAVIYEIKYFMHDYAQRDRIDAEIRKAVWYALRRNGITIPFPIRSFQRYEPTAAAQQHEAGEILHRLARVDILSPLSQAAQQDIAGASSVHVYSRGETIIRQGTAGDSMFIVHEGAVAVRVNDAEVARLQPGDFFGEMALLTGEHRAADVVALSDVVAIEITKNALQPVLQNHPELATAISARVTERRGTIDSLRTEVKDTQASVLSRIRAYFGL